MPRRIGSTLVPRNPVARTLATRRGGAHQASKASERRNVRSNLDNQLETWREDLEFERELNELKKSEN